ncbi:hypothetical protein ACSBR2_011923 [Camellia fascicularis]
MSPLVCALAIYKLMSTVSFNCSTTALPSIATLPQTSSEITSSSSNMIAMVPHFENFLKPLHAFYGSCTKHNNNTNSFSSAQPLHHADESSAPLQFKQTF